MNDYFINLYIFVGKNRLFQDVGNPIIYGGAVEYVEGNPLPGVRFFSHY